MKVTKFTKASLVLASLCAAAIFPLSVQAATPAYDAQQTATAANQKIASVVNHAQNVYATLTKNGASDDSVQVQQQIANLQKQTDAIAAQTENKLNKLGVQYKCTYYTVTIGGSTVIIDPFLCIA